MLNITGTGTISGTSGSAQVYFIEPSAGAGDSSSDDSGSGDDSGASDPFFESKVESATAGYCEISGDGTEFRVMGTKLAPQTSDWGDGGVSDGDIDDYVIYKVGVRNDSEVDMVLSEDPTINVYDGDEQSVTTSLATVFVSDYPTIYSDYALTAGNFTLAAGDSAILYVTVAFTPGEELPEYDTTFNFTVELNWEEAPSSDE